MSPNFLVIILIYELINAMLKHRNGTPFKYQKVFGIGLGKTGTTSLTEALEELGYNKAIHFPIDDHNMSLVLNGYYDAATDTPIARDYKKLLELYPEAGFILTTRELQSWLKSMETHMTKGRGKHGARRSNIAKLRTDLYGSKKFDRELYEQAFKTHLMNVIEHFTETGNMDRLLIHSFSDNPGWEVLCKFLELEVPDIDFPHLNKGVYSV